MTATTSPSPIGEEELRALEAGTHTDPHRVLGAHLLTADTIVIRARRPGAAEVAALLTDGGTIPLAHLGHGIWEGTAPGVDVPAYRLRASYVWRSASGEQERSEWTADDPYRYLPTVGELDLYLFSHGDHEQPWLFLGARLIDGTAAGETTPGTAFTVWAPHARAVRVVGDFNGWNGAGHAMRRLDDSGVWEIFVPDVGEGVPYKFEILTPASGWRLHADPYARATECPPRTASLTTTAHHVWEDAAWMAARATKTAHDHPMSIYEMHLGSWRELSGYRELADPLIAYLRETHFTHVEFLPLMEHPFGGSWGYQVTGYYAPSAKWGSPDDLRYLVDRLHQAGFGVICDWVPAHFPKDAWALADFDGEPLYEYADPRRGEHPDWGTKVFDFGRNEVRNFLLGSALYWLEEFHVDGLRVDAVASMLYLDYSRQPGQWLPNVNGGRENYEAVSLLQQVNATAYRRHPGIVMVAEESTSWPGVTRPTDAGGLGFGFKWNMGWMHDSLEFIEIDPMWRADHRDDITRSMLYAYSENYILPISHDEVVHGKGSLLGKMPGDDPRRFASLRSYLAFMWTHPGKKLLFMGQEFGQTAEWSESRALPWDELDSPMHRGLQRLVADMNTIYASTPALWERDSDPGGFAWIETAGRDVVAFDRWDQNGNPLVSATNFGGSDATVHLTMPADGVWSETLNTDASVYEGSGKGNLGSVRAARESDGGVRASVFLPALATIWFQRDSDV